MLAVAAQDAAIIEKTRDATLLLVSDLVLKDLDANSVTFGDVVFLNPPATETVKGVVELADTAEATAGDDDQRAMTPAKVHQAFKQFGLGRDNSQNAVLDDIEVTSIQAWDNNDPSAPFNGGAVITLKASAKTHGAQLAVASGNEGISYRPLEKGVWATEWFHLWHTGNMGRAVA
ncbi:hypothetical protein SY89_03531 [Halolamina pelagica]|uniref:Uncharacterized protein n=1 Tax=Halolamina pelagica TaxID=699431 RepID=A0A0P7GTU6_9EURY|nr:hypothetical protein [Halolamina pelagica]KPN28879.1 hypothetical protein SY89_03531 [Halolamina pelagica]